MCPMDNRRNQDEPPGGIRALASDLFNPAAVVLAHDRFFGAEETDCTAWSETIFYPMTIISECGVRVIEDAAMLESLLLELSAAARAAGIVQLRTEVVSQHRSAEDMSILTTRRSRLDREGTPLAISSVTWVVIWVDGAWKINQAHFNDTRHDLSVVSLTSQHTETQPAGAEPAGARSSGALSTGE